MEVQNLVGWRLFTFILNQEIQKATRFQYCVSVLCLTLDLPRRESTFAFTRRLAKLSAALVRTTDLAARLDPSSVALLLIDAETRHLPGILQRLKESLDVIPGLTLDGGGGCYPQTATSGSDLLQQAVTLMGRAKAEGGGQCYLPS